MYTVDNILASLPRLGERERMDAYFARTGFSRPKWRKAVLAHRSELVTRGFGLVCWTRGHSYVKLDGTFYQYIRRTK